MHDVIYDLEAHDRLVVERGMNGSSQDADALMARASLPDGAVLDFGGDDNIVCDRIAIRVTGATLDAFLQTQMDYL